ncbi:MAG: HEAT repeat domain-containing protein [Labilithrix sp.]|nr:HEAT repeat domain-containing protein [Labilithrix sp.]
MAAASSRRLVRRASHLFALLFALGAASAATDAAAQAKPNEKKDEKKPAAVDVKPIVAKIKTGEEGAMKDAFDELRIAGPGGAAAAPAVAEALSRGLSLSLTQAAIETLGDLESEAGSAAVAQYATHRNSKVRRAAVKALTRTKGPAASAALKRALSDGDAVIRGTAASGLGSIKAKDAVGPLFVALDHRVNEAAASLGQLCSMEQCEQLAGKLGKLPFDVVTTGLDQVLFRPAAEIPDDAKLKIIGRVRELGTIEANKFLRDVQKRWPAAWSGRVRQAIDQAVLATSGGAQ